jgi:hypothetical protein
VNVWMVSKNLKHGLMTRGVPIEHGAAASTPRASHAAVH